MKPAPLQTSTLVYGQRDDDSVEVELQEVPGAAPKIVVRDLAFTPVAALLDAARKDPALAARVASDEPDALEVDGGDVAIVDAPPGPARDALRERRLADGWNEVGPIVVVRAGDERSPPLLREHVATAFQNIDRCVEEWTKLRAREAKRVERLAYIAAIPRHFDLGAPKLEPWVEEELARLEATAVLVDELTAIDPPDVEKMATAFVKRRWLLEALHAAGLFDETATPRKNAHLARLRLRTLSSYFKAALTLRQYLRSPERLRYIKDIDPEEPLLAARISIDWFRPDTAGGASGPGLRKDGTPFALLVYAESCFHDYWEYSGGFGEIMARAGGWSTIRWRRDDGVDAKLLALIAH